MLKLLEALKYFKDSAKYKTIVNEIEVLNAGGCHKQAKELLESLPDERTLLAEMYEKLKGKSVSKTLERIGQADATKLEEGKGYSSLMTHCFIEMEQGGVEYKMLIHRLYEKLGAIIYES